MKNITLYTCAERSKGFSLVELMVAMVLGLILIGAATGVMLSNTQSFRAAKNITQIQDSARLGFELIARDIRQAGSIPCGNNIDMPAEEDVTPWYLDWNADSKGQLIGYTTGSSLADLNNPGEGKIASGTQALTILYANNIGTILTNISTFDNSKRHFKNGDTVLICDGAKGSIFTAVIAAEGAPISNIPENFKKNSVLSKLKSRAWYIGKNNKDGNSLYLAELNSKGLQRIEIASGVSDIKFKYRSNNDADFKIADSVNQWTQVNAVQITPTLHIEDQEKNTVKHTFSSIVAVRNRLL